MLLKDIEVIREEKFYQIKKEDYNNTHQDTELSVKYSNLLSIRIKNTTAEGILCSLIDENNDIITPMESSYSKEHWTFKFGTFEYNQFTNIKYYKAPEYKNYILKLETYTKTSKKMI